MTIFLKIIILIYTKEINQNIFIINLEKDIHFKIKYKEE
jgi:hypothetical protein